MSLDTTKACLDNDIPRKILKENADIFSDPLFAYYNASVVKSSKFLSLSKEIKNVKIIIDQWVSHSICQNFLKE